MAVYYRGPHSTIAWQLHGGPPNPPLRQHDSGPDVPDLIHPGDWFITSYDTGGMVVDIHREVIQIEERTVTAYNLRYWARCKLDDAARSNHISLNDFWYCNEVVAVGGKLRHLFLANKDTLRVVRMPRDIVVADRARAFIKKINQPKQLSLFGG